ncbi:lipase maturation factor family protein [Catellatospora citrea]|uniref:Membrane protein n=1 Tax=Catellatospora citrea TaxID=53366 RepID=A0A8J3KHR7_9ACTN|nr:lipase maturation factor family protein [Catellatospora citrea]RKE05827.1 lipase maturation factor [Catellatospora citrea]GIF97188.1 membrane protein [Catellatospora citrea]
MDWFTAPEYWWSRLLFQRGLAAVYLLAFLVAANQFRALLGEHGLTPVPRFLARTPWRRAPSIFHLRYSDGLLTAVAWTGVAVSAALLVGVGDAVPLWAATAMWSLLWLLYLSIVNVGQLWYGFGWESLLLEAGFLAIFLGNARVGPPVAVLWLLRWLLFRLEFGAGLIKIRGDRCWRDLTCLYYHHETQPMPGPLSWWFHHLPRPLHRAEAAANHVTQLVVPFGLFLPQPFASAAAAVIIVTQLWLVASGNFSWLNWIAIILAASALDLSPLLGTGVAAAGPPWHQVLVFAAAALVIVLSYRPARNLVSRRQLMNFSFDPLHLVNTYGAFGSITKVRHEIVIEGTDESALGPQTVWREYGFKGKPGDPRRLPRQFAPYHLRLDWLMWFAAMSPLYAHPWLLDLVGRLLAGDRALLRLLRGNPFPDQPPTYVRALLYRYRFTTRAERRATGAWWHRTLVDEYLPPTALKHGVRSPHGP